MQCRNILESDEGLAAVGSGSGGEVRTQPWIVCARLALLWVCALVVGVTIWRRLCVCSLAVRVQLGRACAARPCVCSLPAELLSPAPTQRGLDERAEQGPPCPSRGRPLALPRCAQCLPHIRVLRRGLPHATPSPKERD